MLFQRLDPLLKLQLPLERFDFLLEGVVNTFLRIKLIRFRGVSGLGVIELAS